MFKLSQITKDYGEASPLCANINLFSFLDEEIFLTKSGDFRFLLNSAKVHTQYDPMKFEPVHVRRLGRV